MEHKYWQNIGNALVAVSPIADIVIFNVTHSSGENIKHANVSFHFDAADAEKIGRALVAAAHAARPALVEVRPAETEDV
jgi:hypothetical protein